MKLVKRNLTMTRLDDFSKARVCECLEALGMLPAPRSGRKGYIGPKRYRRIQRFEGFRGQDRFELEDIFQEAKTTFYARIKETHPDKNPRHAKQARRLIAAWGQLKKLFYRHGIGKGD